MTAKPKRKDALQEEFDDTKGVIRSIKSKKDRHHNGQKKKGQTTIYKTDNTLAKRTNNDLQNTTGETKDRATMTNAHEPTKTGVLEPFSP